MAVVVCGYLKFWAHGGVFKAGYRGGVCLRIPVRDPDLSAYPVKYVIESETDKKIELSPSHKTTAMQYPKI